MLSKLVNYLVLPKTCSAFEQDYLTRMNRVGLVFFAVHVPLFSLIAFFNDTGPVLAAVLTSLTLAGPAIAARCWKSQRAISTVMGVTAMFMGGLLVHFGQGPVQIEMHFYFFVLIALLAVFANPMVIVAAAVTAALHHAALWLLLPTSIFNYDAPFWVVAVHAAFVVLESVAACFIARSFFDNVIGLEKKVEERTREVNRRNDDMRMILDSVEQGFFTIDSEGEMSEERSAAVETLLGPTDGRTSLIEIMEQYDGKAAGWMSLGLDDVFHGLLPVEVTIDQLPERVAFDNRTLCFHYNPVWNGEKLSKLAVVVSDISSEVEKERLETEMREMMAMIDRISADKTGFLEFFQEAEGIVKALKDRHKTDIVLVKRQVHTLKGNASIFGLTRVADACHVIEDFIAEQGTLPEDCEWTRLFGCWSATKGNLRRITADETAEVSLKDEEYRSLLISILNAEAKEVLASRVASWKLEPTERRLRRLADQTKQLGERLNKGNIGVRVYHGGLRTDPENWSDFWSSIIHVVRNAVDHGLEDPSDRELRGKPANGEITFKTYVDGDKYVIAIADDGKGIDFERIAQLAAERDLPHGSREDLVEAIFSDGFSTADAVTDTSGRGVGMAAVRAACEALGGTIEVDTEPGAGTEFRFVFGVETMAPNTSALLRKHGIERKVWDDSLLTATNR